MNNNENKSEALFERLKGGSVFSFLKTAADPMVGPPLPRPEPLVSPQSAGQQDSQDLKKRLAELEAKKDGVGGSR